MAVFLVAAPCSLVVEVYRRFVLMMEAARTSETSLNFYQTTRRYNPEDSHLHTRRRENLKSNGNEPYSIAKGGEFLEQLSEYQLLKRTLFNGVSLLVSE
jgi:hypothetical protein